MLIHGEYINGIGQHVAVSIVTGGDTSDEIEIGVDGVHFSDSPVQITSEVNDTFDVLLTKSATVNLQTDRHIPELYTTSAWTARWCSPDSWSHSPTPSRSSVWPMTLR